MRTAVSGTVSDPDGAGRGCGPVPDGTAGFFPSLFFRAKPDIHIRQMWRKQADIKVLNR